LEEFRRVDDLTPSGTFSATYWADRYAKKAVGRLTKSFVGKIVIGDRLGKLGQEVAIVAREAGKHVYKYIRDNVGRLVDNFKIGLQLWCGERTTAVVQDGMILGTGLATSTSTKEKTISSDAWKRAVQRIEADALLTIISKEEEKERVA